MGDWSEAMVSWSEFLLFHVLPIAVAQIYDWIRDWQVLFATVLALGFLHLWSRAILRSAQKTAREAVQNEIRGLEASLRLLRRHVEGTPRHADMPATYQSQKTLDAVRPVRALPLSDSQAAVERLRQAIRLALGTIPVSDGPLSPEGIRLFRAAIGSLDDVSISEEERQGGLGEIVTELGKLGQAFPPQSCREAWQALVKVNALAREFRTPHSSSSQAGGAIQRATP